MLDLCAMKAVIGTDIRKAAGLLEAGELVAIPTETVYGLAANAFNEEAVLKIFAVKERPAFDPLIVHVGRETDLQKVVAVLPPAAQGLINAFWPGPLTLILPKDPKIPDLVTSGSARVAVRMPAHPTALELLRLLPFPLAAPSANPFGYISPTTARHVADQLGEKIPYILDGGACEVGVESTILGWQEIDGNAIWAIHRFGGISLERIEALIGKVHDGMRSEKPFAPGMLTSHYAPGKPVHVGDVPALMRRFAGKAIGVISFRSEYAAHQCEILSAAGDLNVAARHLFGALRDLDNSDCEVILAEEFPDEGLGRAINDRLRRAATVK